MELRSNEIKISARPSTTRPWCFHASYKFCEQNTPKQSHQPRGRNAGLKTDNGCPRPSIHSTRIAVDHRTSTAPKPMHRTSVAVLEARCCEATCCDTRCSRRGAAKRGAARPDAARRGARSEMLRDEMLHEVLRDEVLEASAAKGGAARRGAARRDAAR